MNKNKRSNEGSWFVFCNEVKHGPFTTKEIKALATEQKISPLSRIAKGDEKPKIAGHHRILREVFYKKKCKFDQSARWFYLDEDLEQKSAISWSQLQKWIDCGRVKPKTVIWLENEGNRGLTAIEHPCIEEYFRARGDISDESYIQTAKSFETHLSHRQLREQVGCGLVIGIIVLIVVCIRSFVSERLLQVLSDLWNGFLTFCFCVTAIVAFLITMFYHPKK